MELINQVFAHHGEEDEIYPLTIKEIVDAQKRDNNLKNYYKPRLVITKKGYAFHIVEEIRVLCKDERLIIPQSLQHRAVSWYHHYLQHPGHSRLEETMRAVIGEV